MMKFASSLVAAAAVFLLAAPASSAVPVDEGVTYRVAQIFGPGGPFVNFTTDDYIRDTDFFGQSDDCFFTVCNVSVRLSNGLGEFDLLEFGNREDDVIQLFFLAGAFAQNGTYAAADDRPYLLTVTGTGAGDPPTAAVPEPATWAMFVVGFGMIGASTRRRAAGRTVVAA